MKRIPFVVVLLLVATTLVLGQEKNAKLEAELIQMDKDWTAAELRGDAKAVGMYVADDFWQTTPDGLLQDRTKYMAGMKASKDTDVADDYTVRFFGDTAIMTHRGTVRGERDLQYRSTHVWVKRGGKWQIVAHHSSEVSPAGEAVKQAPPMKLKVDASGTAVDAAADAPVAPKKP